ncbi:MAG: glycosyltransferase family 2 protein, partial [Proteobacteria bacterium]
MKLSVAIITKNEADNLGACLKSASFADQIIVVDSGSTDNSVEIAKSFGATVIQTTDWPGFGPQKNRAVDAATNEWIFSLDADERITLKLKEEIEKILKLENPKPAYFVPRITNFCGTWIRHSGWYPDYTVRL